MIRREEKRREESEDKEKERVQDKMILIKKIHVTTSIKLITP